MNAFTSRPLGIETIEDADCFKGINRTRKPHLRPWVKFAIRNAILAAAIFSLGALAVWFRSM